MNRRQFNLGPIPLLASAYLLAQQQAHALSISDLSNREATQGLRAALETGATAAVKLPGQTDGFLGNERVRIPLPGYLEDASNLLRVLGQGGRIDELVVAMNRAAQTAMPLAKDLLLGAVRAMNVRDAKSILTGGDTLVIRLFCRKNPFPAEHQVCAGNCPHDLQGRSGRVVQPGRRPGCGHGSGEKGRRHYRALCHGQVARWPLFHDR